MLIVKVFEDLYKNLKLVCSSEIGCCTPGISQENMEQNDGNYHLNSGMMI